MAKIFPAFAAVILLAASTSAQASILVRVSGKGADAAGCGGVAAPCRTLQFAHDQVDAGGYIVALDPADYGQIIARKGINLADESGGLARATPPVEREGAIVALAPPTEIVRIRGFSLESQLPFACGIHAITAKRLEVDAVDIRNMKGVGLNIGSQNHWYSKPSMAIALRNIKISGGDSGIVAVGTAGVYASGLRVENTSSTAAVFSSSYTFYASLWGSVVIKDSVLSNDAASPPTGLALSSSLGFARNLLVRGFQTGVRSSGAVQTLNRSNLTGNLNATTYDSYVDSTGDNIIRGNADDSLRFIKPFTLH